VSKQIRQKQERCIEAIRQRLVGDAAVAFVHDCGFAMTESAFQRHVHALGGRDKIVSLFGENKTNIDILSLHFPKEDFSLLASERLHQGDLFVADAKAAGTVPFAKSNAEEFETTKLTLNLPSDLHQALRMASKAEGKNKTQLIVEILTAAMSQLPEQLEDEDKGEAV
jgi:hypothetical protein